MTSKEDIILSNAIEEVEKQLRVNFENHKWEFVYEDTLKSETDERIRQFVGVTSAYGGVTIGSFLNDGGGYTPYFLKLTELDPLKTRVEIVVTGSERVTGDSAGRNNGVVEVLTQMCQGDYEKWSVKKVFKKLF